MRVTSVGRPVAGEAMSLRKSPGRVGRFRPGDAEAVVRSSHLGYDCYVTGKINDGGKTRIVQRSIRLPAHLTHDVLAHLPVEMWWPERDHTACHALIDAILQFDLGSLRSFKSAYPDHVFGFEKFMVFCERRAATLRSETPVGGARATVRTASADGSGATSFAQLALFPSEVDYTEHLYTTKFDGYETRMSVVRFIDGESALNLEVWGRMPNGRILCSRAYVDMITGDYEVRNHHPGRLQALGLPLGLLHRHLGVRNRAAAGKVVAPREMVKRTPKTQETMQASRRVEAALAGDGGVFTEDLRETQRTTAGKAPPAPVEAEEPMLSFPLVPGK